MAPSYAICCRRLCLYYRCKSLPATELQPANRQQVVTKSHDNDFKFSVAKTICIQLQTQGLFPQLNIFMNNSPLPFADTCRFLWLILDSRLTWGPQQTQLPTKCQRSLNILRALIGAFCNAMQAETLSQLFPAGLRVLYLRLCVQDIFQYLTSSPSVRCFTVQGSWEVEEWKVCAHNEGNLLPSHVCKSCCINMRQS